MNDFNFNPVNSMNRITEVSGDSAKKQKQEQKDKKDKKKESEEDVFELSGKEESSENIPEETIDPSEADSFERNSDKNDIGYGIDPLTLKRLRE